MVGMEFIGRERCCFSDVLVWGVLVVMFGND